MRPAATAAMLALLLCCSSAWGVGVSGTGGGSSKGTTGGGTKPTPQSANRLVPRATEATRRQMSAENLREASIRNGPIRPTVDQSRRQESRGLHYTLDAPNKLPEARPSILRNW